MRQESDGESNCSNPTLQEVHIHIPPLCAPNQATFIDTANEIGGTSQQSRKCFYAPYCQQQARECGGWMKGRCSQYNNGIITVPDDFFSEKEELKRVEMARKAAEKRQRQKEQKAQAKKAKTSA